jgi:hypothetical protein
MRRQEDESRRKEQETKDALSRSTYNIHDDPTYLHAKKLEKVEKEAEEQAKASLQQYSQVDRSHDMVMQNGVMNMVPKSAGAATTSAASRAYDSPVKSAPSAIAYPFLSSNKKYGSSPEKAKALDRFHENLGMNDMFLVSHVHC